jgi:hypothetical protein
MDDSGLERRLESLSPPGLDDARERAKLAARASLSGAYAYRDEGTRERLASIRRRSRRQRRRYLAVLASAGAAVATFLLLIGGIGGGPTAGPPPAVGGDLARLIEASPPILLDVPGWGVEYSDESFSTQGLTNFFRGEGGASAAIEEGRVAEGLQGLAELQWSTESLEERIEGLKSLPERLRRVAEKQDVELAPFVVEEVERAPVLGTTARVIVQSYPANPFFEATGFWEEGDRLLAFRSFVSDIETFRSRLAALRRVDPQTWLEALKDRVVEQRDRGVAVMPRDAKGKER